MTHAEFASAYGRGRIRADFDRAAAGRYLSARLMLPLIALPVLGAGVALALTGHLYAGLAVAAAGMIGPRLIRRAAPGFLLRLALEDPAVYEELVRSRILRVIAADDDAAAPG